MLKKQGASHDRKIKEACQRGLIMLYITCMKQSFLPSPRQFPPCVVGTVIDWKTWLQVINPINILPCRAVELRIDAMPASLSVEDYLSHPCHKPVLVTFRHHDEGGKRVVDEAERIATMKGVMSMACAIDWEIRHMAGAKELLDIAKNSSVRIVASFHDFEKTPTLAELQKLESYAISMGADMVKFAFYLKDEKDILVGAQLLREATCPLSVMGMGPLGPMSRILYAQMGSALIYGYLGDTPAAPGQWPAKLCYEALESLSPIL